MTHILQAAGCIVFGLFAFESISTSLNSSHAELDCFVSIGTYSVCTLTTFIAIYSNLFFLMAQAFVSRVFVPGISIFVNASVRCPSNGCVTLQSKILKQPRAYIAISYTPQVLDSVKQPSSANDDDQPSDL